MCWRMAHGGHQATGTDEGRLALMEGQSQGGGKLTWSFLLVSSLLKLWLYKALIVSLGSIDSFSFYKPLLTLMGHS